MSSGDLGRKAASDAARHELAKRPYQDAKPPLAYRVLQYIFGKIDDALSKATHVTPGGALGLAVILLLVGGFAALIIYRARPGSARFLDDGLFGTGTGLTADGHRKAAEAAAAAGDWAEAVRERLRAVARELEARGVVDPRPGRTADELALEAGTAVPAIAGQLQRGTRVFDDVWYGGRTADAASYASLVEVDTAVRDARLVRS